MKILIYSLISSLLFLSSWCQDDEEDDCRKLPKEISPKIYVNMIDISTGHVLCDESYKIEFWKVHCGGGPSSIMSYDYEGCAWSEGYYVNRKGIGTWSIDFKYEEDNLHLLLLDNNIKELASKTLNGNQIFYYTNDGDKNLVFSAFLTFSDAFQEAQAWFDFK